MSKQTIFHILFALLAATVLRAATAAETPLYQVERGEHAIEAVETFALKDEKRDKTLPLRLTFPKEEGKYPLIVFSHGAMGSKDAYVPLAEHWASHGYVVVQPTHEDSLSLMLASGERFQLKNVWAKWNTRPPDVQLILTSMDQLQKNVKGLAGKIDADHIGVGGHSFGAHTSQLIGGVKMQNPLTKRFQAFEDERPKALLLISPQGTGEALVPESWSGLDRPALVITGTNDKSPRTGQDHLWRREVYDHAPAGDRYLFMIDGAYHGFGGITGLRRFPSSRPANKSHVNYVKSASLAFWDFFLKDREVAASWLREDKYSKATGGAAEMSNKLER